MSIRKTRTLIACGIAALVLGFAGVKEANAGGCGYRSYRSYGGYCGPRYYGGGYGGYCGPRYYAAPRYYGGYCGPRYYAPRYYGCGPRYGGFSVSFGYSGGRGCW